MNDIKKEFARVQNAFRKVKVEMDWLREQQVTQKRQISDLRLQLTQAVRDGMRGASTPTVYIGNEDSKKVHTSECVFVKKIGVHKKVLFKNLASAKRQGYIPCQCLK